VPRHPAEANNNNMKNQITSLSEKIRAHPAVESLEHEDENGWWVYLRAGWIDGESLCHAILEDTLTDVFSKLRFVRREQAPVKVGGAT